MHVVLCYFGRLDFVSFNFALFNENDIEEYKKIESFVHFNVLLKSDRYSGVSVNLQMNTRLTRSHHDNFRTTATAVDVFVLMLLILSSATYLYSIFVTIKLFKVRHKFMYMHRYSIIHARINFHV